jgi:hypothetical protein
VHLRAHSTHSAAERVGGGAAYATVEVAADWEEAEAGWEAGDGNGNTRQYISERAANDVDAQFNPSVDADTIKRTMLKESSTHRRRAGRRWWWAGRRRRARGRRRRAWRRWRRRRRCAKNTPSSVEFLSSTVRSKESMHQACEHIPRDITAARWGSYGEYGRVARHGG